MLCAVNHFSMAYSLSNICTKNYWNTTTIVEIIVGGWVVSFLRHSVGHFRNESFQSNCNGINNLMHHNQQT